MRSVKYSVRLMTMTIFNTRLSRKINGISAEICGNRFRWKGASWVWPNTQFWQANWAGRQTKIHDIVPSHIKVQTCFRYYIKVYNCVLIFYTKIQLTE